MSANLKITADGQVSMAYAAGTETPWHGMGQIILPTDSDEIITKKCGFDFTLIGETAGYQDAQTGQFVALDSKRIVRRSDSGQPIAVVGSGYKFHQPREILGFFLDYAKTFGLKLDTAGVLGDGIRYWAMARTEVEADLNGAGVDIAQLYCLLATSGDGSMTTIADPKAKRVVCNNTWDIAIRDFNAANKKGGKARGSRQSHRSAFSATEAANGLGFNIETSASAFLAQAEVIRSLNSVKVNERMADGFFRTLLRPSLAPEGVMSAEDFLVAFDSSKEREVRGFGELKDAYVNAPGARPGTARGLWEAVTNFIDHKRGDDASARLDSSLFGQGKKIKDQAWDNVLVLTR